MGNLRACFAVAMLALAACGSDNAKTDAGIVLVDAPPDAKVYMDAPPGPTYDLSCLDDAAPTMAPDTITISGTTATFSMSGPQALADVDVDVFEVGTPTAVATVTSDSTGAFTSGDIATGGTPINGYVRGVEAGYRSTYMYPGTVVATSLTGVPVVLISATLFDTVAGQVAQPPQNDAANGAFLVQVTDCAGDPIGDADIIVEQNSTSKGQVFNIGAFLAEAAGTYFVFNVPDGEAQVKVSVSNMSFPVRTVHAYKAPAQGEGTITAVQVTPRN